MVRCLQFVELLTCRCLIKRNTVGTVVEGWLGDWSCDCSTEGLPGGANSALQAIVTICLSRDVKGNVPGTGIWAVVFSSNMVWYRALPSVRGCSEKSGKSRKGKWEARGCARSAVACRTGKNRCSGYSIHVHRLMNCSRHWTFIVKAHYPLYRGLTALMSQAHPLQAMFSNWEVYLEQCYITSVQGYEFAIKPYSVKRFLLFEQNCRWFCILTLKCSWKISVGNYLTSFS